MLDASRISAAHYYDHLPPPAHRCGDIWINLPTFGLLGRGRTSGIVITPACDLSNHKTETVTYIPIISVRSYFSTRAALPLLKERIVGQIQTGGFDPQVDWGEYEFFPPTQQAVERAIQSLNQFLSSGQRGQKEISSVERAISGLRLVMEIIGGEIHDVPEADMAKLFGAEWEKLLRRILTNAFSSNLHFLPSDGQDHAFSAVPSHSLVLFRYPISVPIEVLNLARDASERMWPEIVAEHKGVIPTLEYFEGLFPIKVSCLKTHFLADILCRFIAVYNQVGSPDFTKESISKMIAEVRG